MPMPAGYEGMVELVSAINRTLNSPVWASHGARRHGRPNMARAVSSPPTQHPSVSPTL